MRPAPIRSLQRIAVSTGLAAGWMLLWQCAAPISVKRIHPEKPPRVEMSGASAESILAVIRDAHQRIESGEEDAVIDYNYAVARMVEQIEKSGADPWTRPVRLQGVSGVHSLSARCPDGMSPAAGRLIPADTLEFHGEEAAERTTFEGVGAPLVAVASLTGLGHREIRAKMPARNVTAMVRFEDSRAILDILDPYQVETVDLAGNRRPMAADFGAALMLAMSKARIDKLGLARLLRPARYADTTRLNFIQPYDPERIPVLLVHGLDSTQATFVPLYLKLLEDAEIRRRYQFWVFSYPSGYPYPYSAMLLRRALDDVAEEFPGRQDMVIIGHSMGSLVTRLMVTDAGDRIWRAAFGKPVEETAIPGASRDILIECLVFRHRPEIDRAIFISGPHRGAELASNWVGRLGSGLVQAPAFMADARDAVLSAATADTAGRLLKQAPNSIDTLSPDNAFVREINKIPISSDVVYHSIMGDRGKGDTPHSSDGVVPYWSSHLEGAASEKIVPSGHGAHRHPEGIAEVRRILLLHLRNR